LSEEQENERRLIWMRQWLKFCLLTDKEFNERPEQDEIRDFGRSLSGYNVSREQLIPIFAKKLTLFVVN
jgi:hypothetical protein